MCLLVIKSHVRKPIHEVNCYKILIYEDGSWMTPFQWTTVDPRGTDWFVPKNRFYQKTREFLRGETIEGGYLHATTSIGAYSAKCPAQKGAYDKLPGRPKIDTYYRFHCVARDVVAFGPDYDADLVCRALYIPAFDLTGANRNAIVDYTQLAT